MNELHDSGDGYTPKQYDEDSAAQDEYQMCLSYIVEHAPIEHDDTVVDMGTGTGTGTLALELASKCELVLGRAIADIAREPSAVHGGEFSVRPEENRFEQRWFRYARQCGIRKRQ